VTKATWPSRLSSLWDISFLSGKAAGHGHVLSGKTRRHHRARAMISFMISLAPP
jgi:hypothetical protein